MVVGGVEAIPASKSGGEHEDGGFRGVEIGQQGVNQLELEARIDKNVVLAPREAGLGIVFEGAGNGGANGNDMPTATTPRATRSYPRIWISSPFLTSSSRSTRTSP